MESLILYVVCMYVVCSMFVVCSMYVVIVCRVVCTCSMWYLAKLITVSTYLDVFSWDLDTVILGCDLNRNGVKGHLGVIDLFG